MTLNLRRAVGALLAVLALGAMQPRIASAQDKSPGDWIQDRLRALVEQRKTDLNSRAPEKQKDTSATTDSSTSLVDQSAASDFVSLAMGFVPLDKNDGSPDDKPKATTMTVSAYSLLVWAKGKELTDPESYKKYTNWRRFYITLGTAESSKDTDNSEDLATVVGAKWLIMNSRDIYSGCHFDNVGKATNTDGCAIEKVQEQVSKVAPVLSNLINAVNRILFEAQGGGSQAVFDKFVLDNSPPAEFTKLINNVSPDVKKQIDQALTSALPVFQGMMDTIQKEYDSKRKGQQMALSGTATLRGAAGNDDYRAQFIYDHGLNKAMTLTINASGDYKDRKAAGGDVRTARFAMELLGTIGGSEKLWGRSQATLAVSSEGKWAAGAKPTLTGQVKLTIPLATGIDFPIVYRYANRTVVADKGDAEARMGLSVDIGRLVKILY
jgi:hypothetical protein